MVASTVLWTRSANCCVSKNYEGDITVAADEALRTRIEALMRAGAVRRKVAAAQLEEEIKRREETMRETFRRYVSPRLADKILQDAQLRDSLLSTSDIRTHAVVLFADRKSTR